MASNGTPSPQENSKSSALATFLETNESFQSQILKLRQAPFLDPEEAASETPQFISLEAAGKPKWGQRRLPNGLRIVLFILSVLCVLGMLVVASEELRIGQAKQPPETRRSFSSESFIALLRDLLEAAAFPGTASAQTPSPKTSHINTPPPPPPDTPQKAAHPPCSLDKPEGEDKSSSTDSSQSKASQMAFQCDGQKKDEHSNSKGTESSSSGSPQVSPEPKEAEKQKATGDKFGPLLDDSGADHALLTLDLVLFVLLLIFLVCILVDTLRYELRGHTPDPVFGRLLQTQFKEAKPLSPRFLVRLLCDKRFALVLKRATNLILPAVDESFLKSVRRQSVAEVEVKAAQAELEMSEQAMRSAEQNRDVIQATPRLDAARIRSNTANDAVQSAMASQARWRAFFAWLEDALGKDETFEKLVADRTAGASATIFDGDHAIENFLLYTVRSKLFEAVVKDPDLRYIYLDESDWVSLLGRLISKIDLAKIKEALATSKEKAAATGSDAQGLAYVTLVVLLLIALALLANRPASAKPDDNEQLSALAQQMEKIRATLDAFLARPQQPIEVQCPQPPPVNVTTPAAAPETVNVAPPSINFPAKFALENPYPPINIPSTFKVDVNAAAASKSDGPPNTDCCSKSPTDPPKPGDLSKAVDDTIVRLSTSKKWLDDQFIVKGGDGERCTFSAQLLWRDPRPPHPVAVQVSALDENPLPCARPKNATIYAGQKPIYDTSLHAYISVEEMHRSLRWSSDFGKEFIVLRIHPQDVP